MGYREERKDVRMKEKKGLKNVRKERIMEE
jgi:hypothetical protein